MGFAIDTPKINLALMDQILQMQYGLKEHNLRALHEVEPNAITNCSNCFVVEYQGNWIIAKELLFGATNLDPVFRRYKADIIDFLAAHQVKVARHIRTIDEKGFGEYEGHLIEVLEYFPHSRVGRTLDSNDLDQIAEELGKLDAILISLVGERPDIMVAYQGKPDLYGTTLEDLKQIRDYANLISDHLTQNLSDNQEYRRKEIKLDKVYLDIFFHEVEQQIEEWSAPRDQVAFGLIHRDLWGANALFSQEGRLVSIVDFETMAWMPLLCDPIYSALQGSRKANSAAHIHLKPDYDIFKRFMEKWEKECSGMVKDSLVSGIDSLRRDGMNRTAYFMKDKYLSRSRLDLKIVPNHIAYLKNILDLKQHFA